MSENKSNRGGKRLGAGRKKLTEEDKLIKQAELQDQLIDELIFPAVCTAFHADPGRWNERILTFELSTVQIRNAYGHEGLREWKSYFTALRKGGRNRAGEGYGTLWRFNNAKYGFVLKLVRSLGHDLKDLPNPGFPPTAMLARLKRFEEKQKARQEQQRAAKAAVKG